MILSDKEVLMKSIEIIINLQRNEDLRLFAMEHLGIDENKLFK